MSSVKGKLEYMDFICDVEKDVSLCDIDTIIRIGDDEKKLFGCKDCVYKEVADICPKLIKKEIEDVFYLR